MTALEEDLRLAADLAARVSEEEIFFAAALGSTKAPQAPRYLIRLLPNNEVEVVAAVGTGYYAMRGDRDMYGNIMESLRFEFKALGYPSLDYPILVGKDIPLHTY